MKIPQNIIDRYGVHIWDIDVSMFLSVFDEPLGRSLVVGAHDECTAHMLSETGHEVYGVDLRKHDGKGHRCNYYHIVGDFCKLPLEFEKQYLGTFDTFVSLSTIEHFGLGAYGELPIRAFHDVAGMRKAWEYLKPGGKAYVTVPFGKEFFTVYPHWRVYDEESIIHRLAQDFTILDLAVALSGNATINGEVRGIGSPITYEEARNYSGEPPHVSILVKMVKDGR